MTKLTGDPYALYLLEMIEKEEEAAHIFDDISFEEVDGYIDLLD